VPCRGVDAPNIVGPEEAPSRLHGAREKRRPVRGFSCKFGNRIAKSCMSATSSICLRLSLSFSLSLYRFCVCDPSGDAAAGMSMRCVCVVTSTTCSLRRSSSRFRSSSSTSGFPSQMRSRARWGRPAKTAQVAAGLRNVDSRKALNARASFGRASHIPSVYHPRRIFRF